MASPKRRLNLPDVSLLNLPNIVTCIRWLGDSKETGHAAICEMILLLDTNISNLNNGQDNPSFSAATWKVTTPQSNLDLAQGIAQLEKFNIPSDILPPQTYSTLDPFTGILFSFDFLIFPRT
jgi:hypothetical protein